MKSKGPYRTPVKPPPDIELAFCDRCGVGLANVHMHRTTGRYGHPERGPHRESSVLHQHPRTGFCVKDNSLAWVLVSPEAAKYFATFCNVCKSFGHVVKECRLASVVVKSQECTTGE